MKDRRQGPENTSTSSSSPAAKAPGKVQLKPAAGNVQKSAADWTDDGATHAALGFGGDDSVQHKDARSGLSSEQVHQAAASGVQGASGSLPHLDTIQKSFGSHDVSGVKAQVGGPAAPASEAMGAQAYAVGNNVAFKESPSLHTAAHEAAHVVQQRAGVQLKDGVGQSGDQYEQHADAVADKVVAGESAEALLGEMAPASGSEGVQQQVVQRDDPPSGTPAPTGGGGPAPAAGGDKDKDKDKEGGEDPWEAFKAAVNDYDADGTRAAWAKLAAKDKKKLKTDETTQVRLMHTLNKDSVPMLKGGGVDWSQHVANLTVFLMPDFDQWYPALKSQGMYSSFEAAYPTKGKVSMENAQKLKGWLAQAPNKTVAKGMFERVYPTLNTTPADDMEKVANWSKSRIQRLYNILADSLPVGHVQTITGGFTLINKIKERNDAGKWEWNRLGFAWWEPWSFRCVLNASSSGSSGGGTGHDMTGGDNSGADNSYNVPVPEGAQGPPAPGTNTSLTHFAGSALHEVGHGVGQRMGGDAYALDSSKWPGWTPIDIKPWARGMWIPGATAGARPAGLGRDARLSESDARDFMLTEIRDGSGTWSKWNNSASRADIVTYVNAVYSNQPLYTMWDELVNNGYNRDDAYYLAQKNGGWAYAYLTRPDTPYYKYKAAAYDQKVSWYSMSSPQEWFAEQYAHYYRTERTGGGQMDPATKSFLDTLDTQEFVPNSGDGGATGRVQTDPVRGSGGGGGGGGGGGAPAVAQKPPPGHRPSLFPW